jgi:hypothetical protein
MRHNTIQLLISASLGALVVKASYSYDVSMDAFYYAAASYCNQDLLSKWQCGEACQPGV